MIRRIAPIPPMHTDTEAAMAEKRGAYGPQGRQAPADVKGEQTPYFLHQLRLSRIASEKGPCDMEDQSAVEARRTDYFNACNADGVKPTLPGFALALGTTPAGLMRYPSRAMVESMAMIENVTVQMMEDSRIPMAPGIFLLKNWFGYRDEREVVTHQSSARELDAQEVEARYVEAERVESSSRKRLKQA